jgi:Xaa-Pro aminopeptidase
MTVQVPAGEDLRRAVEAAGADGWLLYDFQTMNPVTRQVLGLTGLGSRRLFVYLPKEGEPVAVVHRIEMQPFEGFAGRVLPYSRWEELHAALGEVVRGRRVAMEVSADDAVPYLDRVPSGVVDLIRRLGGTVVGSAALVTRFAAGWSDAERRSHSAAAEQLAAIAQAAIRRAVGAAGTGLSESALQGEVARAIEAGGLVFDHPPIVGFGPNSANPHYFPEPGADRTLGADEVVLIDLFGGPAPDAVQADQTWIGFSGPRPSARVQLVWDTVRAAREAAIAAVQGAWREGRAIRGFEVDRASRDVIERAGFGEYFVHRTGHSIDRRLHGSGPHLDDYETRDDRVLLPGVGFSVEPGIYLAGEFGMRTEVNMYLTEGEAVVTPTRRQEALITA